MKPVTYIPLVLLVLLVVILHVQILQDVKDEYQHVTQRVKKLAVVEWTERVRLRYAHAIAGAIAGWNSVTKLYADGGITPPAK